MSSFRVLWTIATLGACFSSAASDGPLLVCQMTAVSHFQSDNSLERWNCGQADPNLSLEARESKDIYCKDLEFDPADPSRRGYYTNVYTTASKYGRTRTTSSGRSEAVEEIDRMTGSYSKLIKRVDGSRSETSGVCSVFVRKF